MRTMMVISGSLNLRCDIAYENIVSFTNNIESFVWILIMYYQRVEVYLLQTMAYRKWNKNKHKEAIKTLIF